MLCIRVAVSGFLQSDRAFYVPLNVNNLLFEVVSVVKLLGMTITQDLSGTRTLRISYRK